MKSFFLFLSELTIIVSGMLLIQFFCPINIDILIFAITGILSIAIFVIYTYIIDKTLLPKLKRILIITLATILCTVFIFLVHKYLVKRELNTFAALYFTTTSMIGNFYLKYIYAPKKTEWWRKTCFHIIKQIIFPRKRLRSLYSNIP